MAEGTQQAAAKNGPWRLRQAARELGVHRSTLWLWITAGRERASDGAIVHMPAKRGPSRGYLVTREDYFQFVERLNEGPTQ